MCVGVQSSAEECSPGSGVQEALVRVWWRGLLP